VAVPVVYGTGWEGGAVLAAFFVSSNLVSRLGPPQPQTFADAKGDRRDAWQVYANGAAAALGGIVGLSDAALGLWLVSAAFAAAAADTWGTTVGGWSRVPPRLIWSGRKVPAGTGGGVTLAGSMGAVIGAMIVAGTGTLCSGLPIMLPAVTLIGFVGMVVDSMMGARLQGRFHCEPCNAASEWRVHRCGAATTHESGMAWLNNDGVNFLSTMTAVGAAWASWYWLAPRT
jgi:uncharacterized protein (TIGR00297 family)